MTNTTVHIIDDDKGVRESLATLLDSAGMASSVWESAEAFLAGVDMADCGCILADMRMPGMSGLDLLARLRKSGACPPLIVITGHADVAMAVQALKDGAADFIEKPFDDVTLLAATRSALDRGEKAQRERARLSEMRARVDALTPREREVMSLIVQGLSNKAAAAALDISVRTVEIHRARVMDKMEAPSLSALVRMALELDDQGRAAP